MKRIMIMVMITSVWLLADFSRDDSTQIVTDNATGLEWQDDTNASSIKLTWQGAIDHCEALTLDGGGWRLPNFNELYYIADRSTYNPAMDSTFENVNTSSYYLSSTTHATATHFAWIVYFYNGDDEFIPKNFNYCVRCVRAR